MEIITQIERDFLEAYKSKEERVSSVLRMVKSALKNAEIAAKHPLGNEEAIKILRREVKQRFEAATEYEKASRTSQAEAEKAEAEIIKAYLPAEIPTEEIEKIVKETILELKAESMADMGKVMGAVIKKIGQVADPATISSIVKKNLF